MNTKNVINVISALVVVIGIAILTAVPVSITMDKSAEIAFKLLLSGAIPIIIGIILLLFINIRLKQAKSTL